MRLVVVRRREALSVAVGNQQAYDGGHSMFRTRLTRKSAGSANGILEPKVIVSQRPGVVEWCVQSAA